MTDEVTEQLLWASGRALLRRVSSAVHDPKILGFLLGQQVDLVWPRLFPQIEQTSVYAHLANVALDRRVEIRGQIPATRVRASLQRCTMNSVAGAIVVEAADSA